MRSCLACGDSAPEPFIHIGAVPIQCTALYDDPDAAREAPQAEVDLVLCPTCASVSNAAFEPDLVPYDGDYENSQLFSPKFRDYATDLARRLVSDHDLASKPVVEVGSGKGEFLAMLAEAGVGRATGYDPTYGGEIDDADPSFDIRLLRTNFDQSTVEEPPGLVCMRHVLEHLADPVEVLTSIRSAVRGDPTCVLYVEVPDAAFTFTRAGLWDVIYQHCSYFSAVSVEFVMHRAGFGAIDVQSVFDGQFLAVEGRPTDLTERTHDLAEQVERTLAALRPFAGEYRQLVEQWRERIDTWQGDGRTVALWGGGAKGVTFLNSVAGHIDAVIDVNPRKQGRYLPGTGHEVIGPDSLSGVTPSVVIVMNAAYEAEIRKSLADLGLKPEIAVV